MAKRTIVEETCDRCGKKEKTNEMVIHRPGEPAMKYDLCTECLEDLDSISGGEAYDLKKVSPGEMAKLQDISVAKANKRSAQWTQEDEKFLIDNPLMSHADVAEKLGRTLFGVRTRRSNLRQKGIVL